MPLFIRAATDNQQGNAVCQHQHVQDRTLNMQGTELLSQRVLRRYRFKGCDLLLDSFDLRVQPETYVQRQQNSCGQKHKRQVMAMNLSVLKRQEIPYQGSHRNKNGKEKIGREELSHDITSHIPAIGFEDDRGDHKGE